jgi:hypothetical protein
VPAPVDQPYPGTIVLKVDATNLSQQIFRMRMTVPVKPGPMTFLYPQWLPANHGPSGPLTQLAGLKFTANGKPVEWTRDPVEVFAFHVTVPEGVTHAGSRIPVPVAARPGPGPHRHDRRHPRPAMAVGDAVPGRLRGAPHHGAAVADAAAGWQYGTALETANARATKSSSRRTTWKR